MAAKEAIYTAYVQLMPSMGGFFESIDREMSKVARRMTRVGQQYARNFNNGFRGMERDTKRTLNRSFGGGIALAGTTGRGAGRSFLGGFTNAARGLGRGFGAVLSPLAAPIADAGRRGGYSFAFNFTNMAKFMIKRAAVGLSLAAVSAVPAQVVGGGIARALGIENAKAQLKGLGYGLEEVKGISSNALKAVEGTIFGLDQSINVAATALAAGIPQGEQLERYIRLVGDAATIAGTDLNEMGTIFNKIQANGKVWSQELNMIADRGLPIFSWMADEMGVTQEAFRKMVEDGEVQSDVFVKVMNDRVGGAALAGADTTRGAFMNMRHAMSRLGEATLGKTLPIFKHLFLAIRDVTDAMAKRLGPVMDKLLGMFGNKIVDGITKAKDALIGLLDGTRKSAWITALWVNFWALVDAGKAIKKTFEDMNPFGGLMSDVEGLDLGGKLQKGFDWLLTTVVRLAPVFATAFGYLSNGLQNAIPYIERFAGRIGDLIAFAISKFENADFGAIYYKVSDFVSFFETKVWPILDQIGTTIYNVVTQLGTALEGYLVANEGQINAYLGNIVTALMGLLPIIESLVPYIIIIAGAFASLVMAVAPVIPQVVGLVGTLVTALMPVLTTLATLISENIGLIVGIGAAIGAYMIAVKLLTGVKIAFNAVLAVTHAVQALTSVGMSGMTAAIWLAVGAQNALNTAIKANPIGIIASLIAIVVGALVTWITTTEDGRKAWDGFVGFVSDSIKWLGDVFAGFFGWLGDLFEGFGSWWDSLFSEKNIKANVDVGQTGTGAGGRTGRMPIPALATGGNVMGPTVALVGERRPETVTDLGQTNRFIKNTNKLVEEVRGSNQQAPTIIYEKGAVTVEANNVREPAEVARLVAKELRKQQRR